MVRRTAFIALFAVLTAGPVSAQTSIRIGPALGLNLADFGGDSVAGTSSRTGLVVGAFVSFGFNRNFALQPELLYTQKGAEIDIAGEGQVQFNVSYFEVPLLAQIRFPVQGATPYILAGPAIAFQVDCSGSLEGAGFQVEADCDQADFDIKSTDFSLIGGVGIEVGNVTVSIRYDYGLTKIPESESEVYNRTISLIAGYGFRIGR